MAKLEDNKTHPDHVDHLSTIAEQRQTIAEQRQTIAEQRQTIAEQKDVIDSERNKVFQIADILQRTSVLLSRAIELRDPYTKGHSEHVAEIISNFITKHQLDLSANNIEVVQMAALIHDIGKLGINEIILNKPTMLTEAEFEMIKSHTTLGLKLIEPFLLDPLIGDSVLYHHENYDGSGYPMGLKGTEIPLIARLIRIADYYDALTSSRPYRSALKPSKAITIMQKNSHCFDPELLSIFVKNVQKLSFKS